MHKGFERGLNMGGWVSQYKDESSWENYLTKKDFERVAGWGFDHVRVPFDYPCVYEHGMKYLDRADEWTRSCGLALILDLHRAEGYFFGTLKDNELFTNEKLRGAFIKLWTNITEHFKGSREDDMVFELLNEIVEPTPDRWNALLQDTIKAIREIDPERLIMIGGNAYNSVDTLHELPDYSHDPKIMYTFHYYAPFPFTHQRAGWTDATRELNQVIEYPTDGIGAYMEYNRYCGSDGIQYQGWDKIGIDWLEKAMSPADEFKKAHPNNDVYLGEFGAIEHADIQSRINYVRDVGMLCRKYGYGRAMWAYTMGFGIVDNEREVISDELIKAAAE